MIPLWGFRKSANYTEVFYPAQDSLIHILAKSDNCNIELVCYQKITFDFEIDLSTKDNYLDFIRLNVNKFFLEYEYGIITRIVLQK